MNHLRVEPHFHTPGQAVRYAYAPGDSFYDMLIQGHQGLSNEQSELMNARLVLLLANQVGDLNVLQAAIHAARGGLGAPSTGATP
jgi:Protein of unknown function (DUF2783)